MEKTYNTNKIIHEGKRSRNSMETNIQISKWQYFESFGQKVKSFPTTKHR